MTTAGDIIERGTMKIGLAAGLNNGTEEWEFSDHAEIAQIFIWHGERIHAVQFQYVENGSLVLSKLYGDKADYTKFNVVQLDNRSEYITGINGYTSQGSITSLSFTTNIKKHGPFGRYIHHNQPAQPYHFVNHDPNVHGYVPQPQGGPSGQPIAQSGPSGQPVLPIAYFHPGGQEEEKEFYFDVGQFGRQFCGFYGTANQFGLTSIGLVFKPNTCYWS